MHLPPCVNPLHRICGRDSQHDIPSTAYVMILAVISPCASCNIGRQLRCVAEAERWRTAEAAAHLRPSHTRDCARTHPAEAAPDLIVGSRRIHDRNRRQVGGVAEVDPGLEEPVRGNGRIRGAGETDCLKMAEVACAHESHHFEKAGGDVRLNAGGEDAVADGYDIDGAAERTAQPEVAAVDLNGAGGAQLAVAETEVEEAFAVAEECGIGIDVAVVVVVVVAAAVAVGNVGGVDGKVFAAAVVVSVDAEHNCPHGILPCLDVVAQCALTSQHLEIDYGCCCDAHWAVRDNAEQLVAVACIGLLLHHHG